MIPLSRPSARLPIQQLASCAKDSTFHLRLALWSTRSYFQGSAHLSTLQNFSPTRFLRVSCWYKFWHSGPICTNMKRIGFHAKCNVGPHHHHGASLQHSYGTKKAPSPQPGMCSFSIVITTLCVLQKDWLFLLQISREKSIGGAGVGGAAVVVGAAVGAAGQPHIS